MFGFFQGRIYKNMFGKQKQFEMKRQKKECH